VPRSSAAGLRGLRGQALARAAGSARGELRARVLAFLAEHPAGPSPSARSPAPSAAGPLQPWATCFRFAETRALGGLPVPRSGAPAPAPAPRPVRPLSVRPGPVVRPNGQCYYPRVLADPPTSPPCERCGRPICQPCCTAHPAPAKTSLVEAAFDDLVTVAGDGDTTVADFRRGVHLRRSGQGLQTGCGRLARH